MSMRCPRTWEVEAVRDGRVTGEARAALLGHMRHCSDCAHEREQLEQLATRLRSATELGADDIGARRLRQRVLAEANRRLLQQPSARRTWIATGAALVVLCAGLLAALETPRSAPPALQLSAAAGARYTHERRPHLEYVELNDGTLDVRFHRSPELSLLVRTPDGELHDFGTAFRVSVQRARTTDVSVSEGAVLLQRRGSADMLLHAGETFHVTLPEDAAQEPATPPPSAAEAAGATAPVIHSHAHAKHAPTPPARGSAEQEDRAYLQVLERLRAGDKHEARAAAEAYQRDFPDGFRRLEVERIAHDASESGN